MQQTAESMPAKSSSAHKGMDKSGATRRGNATFSGPTCEAGSAPALGARAFHGITEHARELARELLAIEALDAHCT
jgi:hypothetical protein